jgi:pilus assembly protein CpaF
MRSVTDKWFNDLPATDKSKSFYPALQIILDEARKDAARSSRENNRNLSSRELRSLLTTVAERLGFNLNSRESDEILYYLEGDAEGFGILQYLVDDKSITDIIISNYSSIVVQKGRSNSKTDLKFSNESDYESFVERLLHRAGTTYSTRQPIADGMIDSFARVNAVHKSICTEGPYLTIRLNRFSSIVCEQLINHGMAPRPVFKLLEEYVKNGLTLLIAGEVGTGKTTLARALASTIPFDQTVLVVEDTPEIRLEHPYVRYLQTREENCEGEGRVAPRQCIKAGMRMAMNRIVFGEIRDAEAAEGFIDCCSSGHSGLSTIHAKNVSDCITRLMLFLARAQPGASKDVLQQQITSSVQVIVFVGMCSVTQLRRVLHVREIGCFGDGGIKHRDIFVYNTEHGTPSWSVPNKTSSFLSQNLLETRLAGEALHKLPSLLKSCSKQTDLESNNYG